MKKLFALVALVLGVVSCQKDHAGMDVNMGGEQEVMINVSLPEETRSDSAEGAFENVDFTKYDVRFQCEVHYGTEKKVLPVQISDNGKTATFPVRLIPNRNYTFVVWADLVEQGKTTDLHYNTANGLANITLNDTWVAMDETRDAFTCSEVRNFNRSQAIELTLTRPFAKLRVITTDMKELMGVMPTTVEVKYTTNHFNTYNALTKTPAGELRKEHVQTAIAAYDDNTETDKVLFTDYFFAADAQNVVNFNMDVYDQNNELIDETKSFNTPIPAKRNYVTTIKGNILTYADDITVEVEDAFDGETQWPDANNEAEQLAYAAMFGGEVTLTENVALTQPLTIVEGAKVVINLEGNTLTGAIELAEGAELTVNNGVIKNTDRTVSGITTNGNLTLNNVTIESARHAVRVESGKVIINGGEYKVAPISSSTLHALNVGDDGTTAEVVIKGGTFIGPKGTMADSGSAVNVRNGSSVVIEGGNFSGGKTKTLSGNITVKGGTFDQNPSAFVATGYKAIAADGIYYVLLETIANAAEAEGVTAVTESLADVATALATSNGEATLFMWNDVAYIAKYGKVVIISDADEATTVRGVVEGSTGLTSATVAEGIEVVGNRTFRKCANLETVALPNTLTEIGPAVFQSCSKLANITIPESVTTIGEGAFAECTALTSINIPAGVTRIEADALRATGLVSVEFHEGVTYFGAQAFRDCKQLTEVTIKAPEFTVEANAFGVMSGALPGTTIYVANAEMKAYLESTLAYKNQFTIVAPNSVASKEDLPVENGKLDTNFEEDVNLYGDITVSANETNANSGYGATGVTVTDGAVLNGQGHTLTVNDAWDTCDCVVAAKGGTIKNLTVSSAMRGIFMPGANGDVYIDNVIFDNVIYTFNSDGGDKNYGVYISNSTLNGWTSHSDVHKEVVYTNCSFGEGNGYAFCRPYGPTSFVGCNFDAGFEVEAIGKITFENCTLDGVALTAENLATLVPYNTVNASVK